RVFRIRAENRTWLWFLITPITSLDFGCLYRHLWVSHQDQDYRWKVLRFSQRVPRAFSCRIIQMDLALYRHRGGFFKRLRLQAHLYWSSLQSFLMIGSRSLVIAETRILRD